MWEGIPQVIAAAVAALAAATNVTPAAVGHAFRRANLAHAMCPVAETSDVELHYPDEAHQILADIEERSFWFRHRNRVILWMAQRYPCDGPLLDVGGGNGFQSLALQNVLPSVVMVEPGPDGCRIARARGVRRVVQGQLQDLGLQPDSVGGVGLFDVLEHVRDAPALLRESARVLREDGRLYVTVPAFRVLWNEEDDFARHHRRYTVDTLRAEVESCGLAVDRCAYFFQPVFLPMLILRALPYRLRRRRGALRADAPARTAGHALPGSVERIVMWFLDREQRTLANGDSPAFGSSVLCVAQKHG